MKPEQLREWAGAIEGEKPWAPKVADVCDQLREHAAALEEIERLNAAWKAQQFHLEAEERESAHWQERAEKAERRAERLKAHAEALNGALENLFALVNGEVPSLLEDDHHYELVANALAAYRAEIKGE